MALADYTRCDKCGAKAFYDANIDWEDQNAGDVAALCRGCAATHALAVVPREPGHEPPWHLRRDDKEPPP